jgi:CheY-like chemotaxis protein
MSQPVPPNQPRKTHARSRVLLAEDDGPLRALLVGVLQGDGYEVVEAKDGLELLANIESSLVGDERPLFVVVADVHMPGLTGLDVLAILRCSFVAAPVILITAFGDDDTRAEAWELGASAVFDKPFELEELRAAVLEAAAG